MNLRNAGEKSSLYGRVEGWFSPAFRKNSTEEPKAPDHRGGSLMISAEYSQKADTFNIFCAKWQINTVCAENIKIICVNSH